MRADVIRDFLEAAPDGAGRVLQLLAVAESLTDTVAENLYAIEPIEHLSANAFVRALHYAEFIAERTKEWQFSSDAREIFRKLDRAKPESVQAAHRALLSLAERDDGQVGAFDIPAYLFTPAGKALHLAALDQGF